MMKRTYFQRLLLGIVCAGFFLTSCEDLPPIDYVPRYVLEGYLYNNEPIQNISLMLSQPIQDTFRVQNAVVSTATIRVYEGANVYTLKYRPASPIGEYFYPDAKVLVKPGTHYRIVAIVGNDSLWSETTTPGGEALQWMKKTKDIIQYPTDTNAAFLPVPDSLRLAWNYVEGVNEYLISVACLDTLEYGRYLPVPTNEKNRRIYRFFEKNAPRYNEIMRMGFLQNTTVPAVWSAFKWFGKQEITVYAPNKDYVDWFKLTHFGGSPRYNELYGNVKGNGIGIFAGSWLIRDTTFMLKNQP